MSAEDLMRAAVQPSPEDWQPGDLAICVEEQWSTEFAASPKKDDLLRVAHVCMDNRFLHFHGKPLDLHWQAIAFRKVKPDAAPADDAEWVQQLQHLRRRQPA